jgi:hypothetical protein
VSAALPTIRARRKPHGPVEPVDSEGLAQALLDHLAGLLPGLTVYTSSSRRSQ